MVGPKFMVTNLSVVKYFPIQDQSKIEFRSEAFNVFNNVNLGTPVANATTLNTDLAKSIPQITSLAANGNPRVLQFALKFIF